MNIVDQTIHKFKNDLQITLKKYLYEIVIHGSYALDDFVPNKGDLDYIVATNGDLKDSQISNIIDLHERYRNENGILLLKQLEGTFYPKKILKEPKKPFIGCYIGTGRAGWRKMTKFQNSYMDLKIASEFGILVLGKDISIYKPSELEIKKEQEKDYNMLLSSLKKSELKMDFWISTIHWCARTLYYIKNGCVTSKSNACSWSRNNIDRNEYVELFEYAKHRRYPYGNEKLDDYKKGLSYKLLQYVGNCIKRYSIDN